ncbi:restriction endonuclease [Sunxiuqinia sp. sy24]|uniref:restriction endonuclease n=1 Tax=Sunxiuqinia sp. sy24 TaxID=3461495 RepID=UPI00404650B0
MQSNHTQVISIKKASGEQEAFAIDKLIRSLRNAGAEEDIIQEISSDIEAWIYDGVSTHQIYARAFSMLRKKEKLSASRYKLKKGIMELGPTGYPFEHFVGQIMQHQGFTVEVGQVLPGHCVTHEVDVVATRGKEQHFMECKYGQSPDRIQNVKVPLYIRSRVNDLIKKRQESGEYQDFSFHGWVVTNTRFTSDAIDYGRCSGLHLLSWDYPVGNGLKDLIDREKIYPLTVLNHLTKNQKQQLLDQNIVTCKQLLDHPDLLDFLSLSKNKTHSLMNEIRQILQATKS